MFQAALDQEAVHHLRATLSGTLISRNDEDYENARKVWNAMIDKHPALIVRCMVATDVITAVTFAREQGMAVAVRSGGHSFAGHSTIDGGMLIDLSPMKASQSTGDDASRALNRASPGARWQELLTPTAWG